MAVTSVEEGRLVASAYQSRLAMATGAFELAGQAAAQLVARGAGRSAIAGETVPPRDLFNDLVTRWRRETDHISSITKTVMHRDYQTIIGMGPRAVPLILEELRDRGGHWFWALRSITRGNPADGCVQFDAARLAWLEWGRREGYLS